MKWLMAFAVYLLALLLTGGATLFVVLLLAGPQTHLLPQGLEIAVTLLGWLVVFVVPPYAARAAWHRYDRRPKPVRRRPAVLPLPPERHGMRRR